MQKTDNDFFEEYKRVDTICSDMFSSREGITEYLNQMENTPQGRYRVPTWENDYKHLKRCRWVRNQLAHNNVYGMCKPEDLQFITGFHSRILSQNDPIALCEKTNPVPSRNHAAPERHLPRYDTYMGDDERSGNLLPGCLTLILIALIVIIAAVIIIICSAGM